MNGHDGKHIKVLIGINSIAMNNTQSCSQDGVLSSLMPSVVVDELLGELTKNWNTSKYEDTCVRNQTERRITSTWYKEVTIVPLFRKRKLGHLRTVKLYGIETKLETDVKHLGIKLGLKLL